MDKSLSVRIKKTRKERKVSAKELAQLVSTEDVVMDENNVYKWEKGSVPSHPEVYQKVMLWLENSENTPKEVSKLESLPPLVQNITITIQEYLDSIREQKRMADDHRKTAEKHSEDLKQIIIAQLTTIDQKLNGVGSNLNDVLAGVFQQSLRMEAMGYTTLEALSVLTGKKPDALSKVSDKRQTEAALEHMKQGKPDVKNR